MIVLVQKTNIESYCFSKKSTLDDEKLKDEISDADKETTTKNVMKPLNGLMETSLQRLKNSRIIRKRLKKSAIL